MSDDLPAETRRRWWHWPGRIAVGLVTCLAAVILGQYVQMRVTAARGREELVKVLAETAAKDPRWQWELIQDDLEPLPEADNSMRVILAVAREIGDWDSEDVLDPHLPANRRWTAERLTTLRRALGKREVGLKAALKIKDMPRGRAEVVNSKALSVPLPHAGATRSIFTLFALDVERVLHDNRPGEGPDRLVAMLNAQAAMQDDPFLICLVVRRVGQSMAGDGVERLLGMAVLPDDQLQRLASAFGAVRGERGLRSALRGARSQYHEMFTNLEDGHLSLAEFLAHLEGNPGSSVTTSDRVRAWRYRPRLYEDHALFLRTFNEYLDIAELPPWEQRARWLRSEDEFRSSEGEYQEAGRMVLSLRLIPALTRWTDELTRADAKVACAIVAVAAERFRLANNRWPRSLDELRPRYLAEIPPDPYTGRPLLYASKPNGVAVYSVGQDGVDGKGEVLRLPRGDNGTLPHDLGVRLWDPDHRGLPAEKE